MEKVKELTELEKAELVIKEAEQKKQNEFAEKVNALCKEYGYNLQPLSTITIVKL